MYDIIFSIIGHTPTGSYYTSEEQLIFSICGTVITIVLFTFVDLVFRVFKNFVS